jgi:hypothetical protein
MISDVHLTSNEFKGLEIETMSKEKWASFIIFPLYVLFHIVPVLFVSSFYLLYTYKWNIQKNWWNKMCIVIFRIFTVKIYFSLQWNIFSVFSLVSCRTTFF